MWNGKSVAIDDWARAERCPEGLEADSADFAHPLMFIEPKLPITDFAFDPDSRLHHAMQNEVGLDGRMIWSDTFGPKAIAAFRIDGPDAPYLVLLGARRMPVGAVTVATLAVIDPNDPRPCPADGRFNRAWDLLRTIDQGWISIWLGEGATSPAGILVRRPSDAWEWAFVRFAPSWLFCEADMIVPGGVLA